MRVGRAEAAGANRARGETHSRSDSGVSATIRFEDSAHRRRGSRVRMSEHSYHSEVREPLESAEKTRLGEAGHQRRRGLDWQWKGVAPGKVGI